MRFAKFVFAAAMAVSLAAPALAQNLSLRAPQWAQALLAADVTPTTGGRAMISTEGVALAVRVTIAPASGGIARVIRYDLRGDEGTLFVRRFTGMRWSILTPRASADWTIAAASGCCDDRSSPPNSRRNPVSS